MAKLLPLVQQWLEKSFNNSMTIYKKQSLADCLPTSCQSLAKIPGGF
jgi:hypothetical protein